MKEDLLKKLTDFRFMDGRPRSNYVRKSRIDGNV